MQKVTSRYDEDFVAWTEEQAGMLRELGQTSTNPPLDWENLAEEVESLGISQRRELSSRIGIIIEHLLKLEHSPTRDPRRGWIDTVLRERDEVQTLLATSPSLRSALAEIVEQVGGRTARLVARRLDLYEEATPEVIARLKTIRYSEQQALGDWFPAGSVAGSAT